MISYKTDGVVLKTNDYRGSSVICVILTKDLGRISSICYRARSPKSKFGGDLTTSAKINIVVEKSSKNSIYILKDSHIIEDYKKIQNSLEKVSIYSYMNELMYNGTQENIVDESQFDLLSKAVYILNETDENRDKLLYFTLSFELKLLYTLGILPELNKCVNCENSSDNLLNYYSVELGGLICDTCEKSIKTSNHIDKETKNTLRYLKSNTLKNSYIEQDYKIYKKTSNILRNSLRLYFAKDFLSIKILDEVMNIKHTK